MDNEPDVPVSPDWPDGFRRFTRIFWLHVLLCFAAIALVATPDKTENYNLAISQLTGLDDHPLAGGRYVDVLFDLYYQDERDRLDEVLAELVELDGRFARTGDTSILRARGILSGNRGNYKLDPSGRVSNLLKLSDSSSWGFDTSVAMNIELLEPDYNELIDRLRSIDDGSDGPKLSDYSFSRTSGDLIKCSWSRGSCVVELILKSTGESREFAIDHKRYQLEVMPDQLALPYEIDSTSEFYTDVQNLDRRDAIEKLGTLRNQFLGQDKFGTASLVLVGESAKIFAPWVCALLMSLFMVCVLSLYLGGAARDGAKSSFSIPFIVGLVGICLRLVFLILLPHVTQISFASEVTRLFDLFTVSYLWTSPSAAWHIAAGFLAFLFSQMIVTRG